jgi:hypothetical protein
MNNHKIIATPWQIESARRGALKTVILPYNKPSIIHSGDRLYLAEQWCRSDDYGFFVESTTPEAEMLGWQSAETMPEESARYWFEVVGVTAKRLGQVSFRSFAESGLHLICPEENYPSFEHQAAWNRSYPDTPWGDNLWVQVLDVRNSTNHD